MKNRRSYYRILHVQPDAPAAVIKASYRAVMQQLKMHPDLGGDHAQAVLVNEAFDTLIDPTRRAEYDRSRGHLAAEQREGSRPAADEGPRAEARPVPPRPSTPPRPSAPHRYGAVCGFCGASSQKAGPGTPDSTCVSCGSALFPVEEHQAGDASGRAIERMPRDMPMTLRLSTSRQTAWSGTTEDLSLNGMRFVSQAPIPTGERVQIECDFCSAVAVVKFVRPNERSRGGGWQYGVEFLTLRLKHVRGGLFSTEA